MLVTSQVRATHRTQTMALDALLLQLHTAQQKTASVAIRHVGAYVATRSALTLEQLAAIKPIATTGDKPTIGELFDEIRAAGPVPTMESTEQRWSLTFLDQHGGKLLVVTSSIFTPRDGTIGGRRVLFRNDRLVEFLAKHYAPDEVGASSHA